MSRSEPLPPDVDILSPVSGFTWLPFHIQPAPEEALISWFWRLATHARISAYALGRGSFGAGPHFGCGATRWWSHPDGRLLTQISRRTGLSLHRLRAMTLLDQTPSVFDDEVVDRFNASRFTLRTPKWRPKNRFVICPACLRADREPYVRLLWTLGWAAVCPQHALLLRCECPACDKPLRPPRLLEAAGVLFTPHRCIRCGYDLRQAPLQAAHPQVITLQAALVRGKREGLTDLPGLGRLSWPLTMLTADVLLRILWKGSYQRHLLRLFARIGEELSLPWPAGHPQWRRRYASLALLSWLLEDWPGHLREALGILGAPRLPRAVPDWPQIPASLRQLLQEPLETAPLMRRDGRSSRHRAPPHPRMGSRLRPPVRGCGT